MLFQKIQLNCSEGIKQVTEDYFSEQSCSFLTKTSRSMIPSSDCRSEHRARVELRKKIRTDQEQENAQFEATT